MDPNTTIKHAQDNHVIRPNLHGFMKGKYSLNNLISFYNIYLADEEKTVNVTHLYVSEAFDRVSHSTLLEKMGAHVLDRYTTCLVKIS